MDVYVAMGQIPRSTERISSSIYFFYEINKLFRKQTNRII